MSNIAEPGRREHVNSRHVAGLDLLRLLAASLVMAYHFAFWDWTPRQKLAVALPDSAPQLGASLHFGWIGVEIFFVISGFVIAYTAAGATPRSFLRSRFLRLAPASWVAATVAVLIFWQLDQQDGAKLAWLYVETLVFWPLNAIDGVWWTLGIEISFYALVYVLLRMGRAASLERVMLAVGLLSGAFWAAALVLQAALAGQGGLLGTLHLLVLKAQGNRELQLLLVQQGCQFALGVTLWTVTRSGLTRRRALAIAGLGVACLLEIMGQNGIIARSAQQSLPAWPAVLTWGAAVLLLVLSVVLNDALLRAFGRSAALVRFAGLLTYPLYLLHHAVGIGVAVLLAPYLGGSAVLVGMAAAVGAAAVVAGWIEPRLRAGMVALPPRLAAPFLRGAGRVRPAPFAQGSADGKAGSA